MNTGTRNTGNHPVFDPAAVPASGWQEVWYLRCNDPESGEALWLRFTLLVRCDGSKRVAETWAIHFHKHPDGGVDKTGMKNTHPLAAFRIEYTAPHANTAAFHIADCFFSDQHTFGEVATAEHSIRWDLTITPAQSLAFDFVPAALRRLGLVKNMAITPCEDLRFSGWVEVDGHRRDWRAAPGMQGHLAGPKNGHSWAWAHCNMFVDDAASPQPVILDALSARARLGSGRATPLLSTLYVHVGRHDLRCNGLRDVLRTKSAYGLQGWTFTARKGDWTIRGEIQGKQDHYAGLTYEDTDGSKLYCYNSKVSDMTLELRRGNDAPVRCFSKGTTAFEVVTREKIPGIPLVI